MSKVAIVTGAARGIGAATAQRLAQDGFAVAVLDLKADDCADTVSAIESAGGKALAVGADFFMRRPYDTHQLFDRISRVLAERVSV